MQNYRIVEEVEENLTAMSLQCTNALPSREKQTAYRSTCGNEF